MNNDTNKTLEEMISTPEGLDRLIEMIKQYKERNKKEIATDQQEENNKIVYDYTKLLKRINKKYNNSISDFNKDIEWDEGDIFKKLHGFSYFTRDEIDRVIKALDISSTDELEELFFTHKTDKTFKVTRIDHDLGIIFDDLEKIEIIANQIHDEYFLSYDPEDEGDRFEIAANFLRNRALIHIVVDNIFDMKKSINKISDRLDLNLR
jgi:predicted RND superfamily exporter protein